MKGGLWASQAYSFRCVSFCCGCEGVGLVVICLAVVLVSMNVACVHARLFVCTYSVHIQQQCCTPQHKDHVLQLHVRSVAWRKYSLFVMWAWCVRYVWLCCARGVCEGDITMLLYLVLYPCGGCVLTGVLVFASHPLSQLHRRFRCLCAGTCDG